MKIQLKDKIWLISYKTLCGLSIGEDVVLDKFDLIYSGRVSEISEEIAEKCADYNYFASMYLLYDSPSEDGILADYRAMTAKRSIQSACKDEYCLIYKTN